VLSSVIKSNYKTLMVWSAVCLHIMCQSLNFHSFVFNVVVLLLLASSGTKSYPEYKGKESTSLML
jgi:hypothetical protein